MFAVIPGKRIDDLFVLAGAKRGDDQCLGLTAGEKRAAMGPGQDPDLALDGTHRFGIASIDAPAGLQYGATHDVPLQTLEQCRQ